MLLAGLLHHHVENAYSIVGTEDGKPIDGHDHVCFRDTEHYRASLQTMPSPIDNTILLYWEDDYLSCDVTSETLSDVFAKMRLNGIEVGSEADGISNVEATTSTGSNIYDISGRITKALHKGDVIIRNGKKIIIK